MRRIVREVSHIRWHIWYFIHHCIFRFLFIGCGLHIAWRRWLWQISLSQWCTKVSNKWIHLSSNSIKFPHLPIWEEYWPDIALHSCYDAFPTSTFVFLLRRAATIVLREENCHFLRVDKEDFNRILRVGGHLHRFLINHDMVQPCHGRSSRITLRRFCCNTTSSCNTNYSNEWSPLQKIRSLKWLLFRLAISCTSFSCYRMLRPTLSGWRNTIKTS